MTEKDIENAILAWLSVQPNCFAWKNQSVGVFDPIKKIYRKSNNKYHVNGTPDIIVCLNVFDIGVFVGLEVKSKYGKQNENQKKFQVRLEDKKGLYFVVRSVEETKEALKHAYSKILSHLSKAVLKET